MRYVTLETILQTLVQKRVAISTENLQRCSGDPLAIVADLRCRLLQEIIDELSAWPAIDSDAHQEPQTCCEQAKENDLVLYNKLQKIEDRLFNIESDKIEFAKGTTRINKLLNLLESLTPRISQLEEEVTRIERNYKDWVGNHERRLIDLESKIEKLTRFGLTGPQGPQGCQGLPGLDRVCMEDLPGEIQTEAFSKKLATILEEEVNDLTIICKTHPSETAKSVYTILCGVFGTMIDKLTSPKESARRKPIMEELLD